MSQGHGKAASLENLIYAFFNLVKTSQNNRATARDVNCDIGTESANDD